METKIKFYFDEPMPRVVARELVKRGIEVIYAADVNLLNKDDDTEHLPYATERGCVLVTRDFPFAGRTISRTDHARLVCWTGDRQDIGGMVLRLAEFVEKHSLEDIKGQVFWIK